MYSTNNRGLLRIKAFKAICSTKMQVLIIAIRMLGLLSKIRQPGHRISHLDGRRVWPQYNQRFFQDNRLWIRIAWWHKWLVKQGQWRATNISKEKGMVSQITLSCSRNSPLTKQVSSKKIRLMLNSKGLTLTDHLYKEVPCLNLATRPLQPQRCLIQFKFQLVLSY